MAGASLQGYTIPTGSRKIKRFQREKLAFNSLEPFFMPIKARFHVNWSLHLICDASVENLYEETATTNR